MKELNFFIKTGLLLMFLLLPFVSAVTQEGFPLVVTNTTGGLLTDYHNLTLVFSEESQSCADTVFYNNTFVDGIVNGRSNITVFDVNTTYNGVYWACVEIDNSYVGSLNKTIGQGLINNRGMNETSNYFFNELNATSLYANGVLVATENNVTDLLVNITALNDFNVSITKNSDDILGLVENITDINLTITNISNTLNDFNTSYVTIKDVEGNLSLLWTNISNLEEHTASLNLSIISVTETNLTYVETNLSEIAQNLSVLFNLSDELFYNVSVNDGKVADINLTFVTNPELQGVNNTDWNISVEANAGNITELRNALQTNITYSETNDTQQTIDILSLNLSVDTLDNRTLEITSNISDNLDWNNSIELLNNETLNINTTLELLRNDTDNINLSFVTRKDSETNLSDIYNNFSLTNEHIESLNRTLNDVNITLDDLGDAILDLQLNVSDINTTLGSYGNRLNDVERNITDLNFTVEDNSDLIIDLFLNVTNINLTLNNLSNIVDDLNYSVEGNSIDIADLFLNITDHNTTLNSYGNLFLNINTSLEDNRNFTESINTSRLDANVTTDQSAANYYVVWNNDSSLGYSFSLYDDIGQLIINDSTNLNVTEGMIYVLNQSVATENNITDLLINISALEASTSRADSNITGDSAQNYFLVGNNETDITYSFSMYDDVGQVLFNQTMINVSGDIIMIDNFSVLTDNNMTDLLDNITILGNDVLSINQSKIPDANVTTDGGAGNYFTIWNNESDLGYSRSLYDDIGQILLNDSTNLNVTEGMIYVLNQSVALANDTYATDNNITELWTNISQLTTSGGGNITGGGTANYAVLWDGSTSITEFMSLYDDGAQLLINKTVLNMSDSDVVSVNNINFSDGTQISTAPSSSDTTAINKSSYAYGTKNNLRVSNANPDPETIILLHFESDIAEGRNTNGGTSFLDSSLYMNPITPTGTINIANDTSVTGKFGDVADFDGGANSYLSVSNAGGGDWTWGNWGTNNFSFDFWANLNSAPGANGMYVFAYYQAAVEERSIRFANISNRIVLEYKNIDAASPWGANVTGVEDGADNAINITNLVGEWHHYAVVRNGTQLLIFLDGKLLADDVITTNSPLRTATPQIGTYNSGSFLFDGFMDEFRFKLGGDATWETNFSVPTSPYYGSPQSALNISYDSLTLYDGENATTVNNGFMTPYINNTGFDGIACDDSACAGNDTIFNKSMWWYAYVINNGTNTNSLLSKDSQAPIMPESYTYRSLVSSVYVDSNGNFSGFNHVGDQYIYSAPIKVIDSAGGTTTASIDLSATVPEQSLTKGVFGKMLTNGAFTLNMNPTKFKNTIASDNSITSFSVYNGYSGPPGPSEWAVRVLVEEQLIYYQLDANTFDLWVTGFTTR